MIPAPITAPISVIRTQIRFLPDSSRVLLRSFLTSDTNRVLKIIARVLSLSDDTVKQLLNEVIDEFSGRHLDAKKLLESHYQKVSGYLPEGTPPLDLGRQLLIGAYFTHEYSLESAALFNPSIVAAPDQSDLPPGALRFITSLRATGEGHLSSIEFRSGVLLANNEIQIDPIDRFVRAPDLIADPTYEKSVFRKKLSEVGITNSATEILNPLSENFTLHELNSTLENYKAQIASERAVHQSTSSNENPCPTTHLTNSEQRALDIILWLAKSNYEVQFSANTPVSERIIFPVSDNERNGIEDARFVKFIQEDGSTIYYATYTAYDGRVVLPHLLQTRDFLRFKINTLNGRAVQNKGMALFPRKINGQYAMISRQDNENLFLMYSDNLHFWETALPLLQPVQPWEFIQMGNCGSPIETKEGWLLLTHGVGAMRKYCIGAVLLDRDDPQKVIGRLRNPLLKPNVNEREGYVPNVVYTCGALIHEGKLIMPYAMSDYASSVAIIQVDELLAHLKADGPF